MGLDIRDVQLVVHISCPKSILSYWQEAGHCARDGRQGFSLILYDGFTLELKTMDKDMAAVVTTSCTSRISNPIPKATVAIMHRIRLLPLLNSVSILSFVFSVPDALIILTCTI
jgi:superfamily II DNA helicase RecQ